MKTLEINNDIYQALADSFGESALRENLDEILLSAIESKLEKYNRDILLLEAKYGVTFVEFVKKWDGGAIKEPHSYDVESDYVDWEMYEMEKKDLLSAFSRMKRALSK